MITETLTLLYLCGWFRSVGREFRSRGKGGNIRGGKNANWVTAANQANRECGQDMSEARLEPRARGGVAGDSPRVDEVRVQVRLHRSAQRTVGSDERQEEVQRLPQSFLLQGLCAQRARDEVAPFDLRRDGGKGSQVTAGLRESRAGVSQHSEETQSSSKDTKCVARSKKVGCSLRG